MGINRTSNALVPNQCGEYDVAAAFGRPSLLKLMRRRSDPIVIGSDGTRWATVTHEPRNENVHFFFEKAQSVSNPSDQETESPGEELLAGNMNRSARGESESGMNFTCTGGTGLSRRQTQKKKGRRKETEKPCHY